MQPLGAYGIPFRVGTTMPRFYFDFYDGDYLCRDDEGAELNSVVAAKEQAIITLAEIARDETPTDDRHTFSMDIRDGSGAILFTVRVSVSVEQATFDALGA
jgi:hypothetical protein